jgi:hypothetical protein
MKLLTRPTGAFMKSMIVATLLSLSSLCFATTHVTHNYSQSLGEIALENACLTETTVRTIKPIRTCATALVSRENPSHSERDNGGLTWYCPRFEVKHIENPRAIERTVCTDLRNVGSGERGNLQCVAYGKKADFLPDTIKIQVWKESGDHNSTWPGVTKRFTFPTCK